MQRRPLKNAPSLLLATGCAVALAAASACGNDPVTPNNGGAGTNPGTAGGGAGGQTGGGATAVSGNASGGAATAGANGAGTAGTTSGGGGGGGASGGGTAPACKPVTAINGSGLAISATDISAFKYSPIPNADVTKMAYDPLGKVIVILNGMNGQMYSLDPNVALPATAMGSPLTTTKAYDSGGFQTPAGYGSGVYLPYRGIGFAADGTLYVMAAKEGGVSISKGAPPATPGGARTWTTLVATSETFPKGAADNYNHSFSGIAVSADGKSLFFNSGSRTEHGEPEGGPGEGREYPLSSAIIKVPTDAPTDLKAMQVGAPYIYADGTRNAFDLEFNAAGDLIGTDNGPDMDLPDELNFIEQGKHYGFPWRFGDVDNPTREASYTNAGDKRLRAPYAVASYTADGGFPAAPGAFTDPIRNMGPDANYLRATRDADNPAKAGPEGLAGVTGHRSPLGLAFDTAGALCGEYYKEGFLLSYGSLVTASFPDPGEDLLLIKLTKANGSYSMTAKQIAKGIKFPMDALLIGNKLFTLGRGDAGQIFVFVLPTP